MTEPASIWVNPKVLRWARNRVKMSPEQVEEESKRLKRRFFTPVTAQQIKNWELGIEEPELEHLETLSEVYHCPVGYFFLEKIPREVLPFSYRGISKNKDKLSQTTIKSLLWFYETASWVVYLVESLQIEWQIKIPRKIKLTNKDLGEIVDEERKRLGWSVRVRRELAGDPTSLYNWWRRAIENLGVFCFEAKLEPSEVRGASFWLEGYAFILVNRQNVEADTGRLFTLLHEYAHLITGKGEVCDFRGSKKGFRPEPFANRFSAYMLISPYELKAYLEERGLFSFRENWSDHILNNIRKDFGVSRDVIAITLQELDLAPQNFYEQKLKQWEKRKFFGRGGKGRPTLKEQKLREFGFAFSRLLVWASEHPSFRWSDALDILEMGAKIKKVEDFIEWVKTEKL